MNKCIKRQGQCSICGMVKEHDGETICPLEIYDEFDQWKCPADQSNCEKILLLIVAIAGAAGLAKALGIW